MDRILIKDFNLGGIADSKHSGLKNSLARMVGWDIHSLPGVLQVNQKMTQLTDSGNEPDEFCKVAVHASNGYIYWMSSTSGKIWKHDLSTDTFSLLTTIVPTSGSAAILSAAEHAGYIYIATNHYLHRITVADDTVAQNWQALVNQGAYHPMRAVNLLLYIGDGNDVHQINESNTYTAEALDLPVGYVITALGHASTRLLIGAFLESEVNKSTIFRWNTWSSSFESSDDVWENGIWSFLDADNYVLVNAGKSGSIYYYNMEGLEFFKRIAGVYSPTAEAMIHPYATAMFKGSIPIFGVSNITGAPCDAGIWSLGRHSRNYPMVFNLEFPISEVDGSGYHKLGSGVQVGAIIVSGVDVYQSYTDGSNIGVDKLDYSNKIAQPFFETRVMIPDSVEMTPFHKFNVGYVSLPDGTSIVIKVSSNYATYSDAFTEKTDNIRSTVYCDGDRLEARTAQLRIEAVCSSNDAPSIDEVSAIVN